MDTTTSVHLKIKEIHDKTMQNGKNDKQSKDIATLAFHWQSLRGCEQLQAYLPSTGNFAYCVISTISHVHRMVMIDRVSVSSQQLKKVDSSPLGHKLWQLWQGKKTIRQKYCKRKNKAVGTWYATIKKWYICQREKWIDIQPTTNATASKKPRAPNQQQDHITLLGIDWP